MFHFRSIPIVRKLLPSSRLGPATLSDSKEGELRRVGAKHLAPTNKQTNGGKVFVCLMQLITLQVANNTASLRPASQSINHRQTTTWQKCSPFSPSFCPLCLGRCSPVYLSRKAAPLEFPPFCSLSSQKSTVIADRWGETSSRSRLSKDKN